MSQLFGIAATELSYEKFTMENGEVHFAESK